LRLARVQRAAAQPFGPEDLVHISAHELRNIAASVYGCARTLLDSGSALSDATKRELLTVIVEQSGRMEQMTEEP
jgi:nitrogen-specific signal transduction histidine kinase